jgi:Tol biopolymer transport system component
MALSAGIRLGPYEVLSALGAGGMGEVYRARDTKLNRDVAIKVLPDLVAGDPDRLARFEREAQVLASLNHPNIAHIHGLEESGSGQAAIRAIVMELVEGPTLADRIARGPIPLSEALPIAKQIAEALEAAHEQGITHRDLKPANIKVREDGTAKVLDFGLAKIGEAEGRGPSLSNSPTITAVSRPGMIFGTAAYMSPEQAKGLGTDRTSDVWAFGCVLYEMLTGSAAFHGDSVSEILSEVLKSEPDWGRLPADTPESIRRLLRRSLQKNRKLRLHDIADARIEIDDARSAPRDEGRATPGAVRSRERIVWISAFGFVALIAAVWALWGSRPPAPAAEMRVDIATPPTTDTVSMAISPDGQKVVFVAISEGRSRLWLRALSSDAARPLEGTDRASLPFWSADSRSVAFFADGKLQRIDIDGGSIAVLADAVLGRGGAWNRDGDLLFAAGPAAPILRISDAGGEPASVTRVETPQQVGHGYPQFLPDGRHFLYFVLGSPEAGGVYVGQLGSSETKRLLPADAAAVYAPSGHLLFIRRSTLYAQDFDPVQRVLTGNPFPVAEGVAVDADGQSALSASAAGPIVYRTGPADTPRQLVWFDQSGREIGTIGDPDLARPAVSLSPDGRRVAVFKRVNSNIDIFLLETERGLPNRFTVDLADDIFPVWSPDGNRIVFSSTRKGGLDLFLKSASGTGNEELLLATPGLDVASDWSPDGRFLLYFSADPKSGYDIWTLPLNGGGKPFPIVQTKSNERLAQFSPDGKWITYESDESGRYEIYVQPFSDADGKVGGKVPVSSKGGAQVRWQHDGKALFYIALDDRLMAVPLGFASGGQVVEPGEPVPLFATKVGGALQPFPRYQYSVSDDRRFLMLVEREDAAPPPITVLLNWAARQPAAASAKP